MASVAFAGRGALFGNSTRESRAGVSLAPPTEGRLGSNDNTLALERSPGRRDACPTLVDARGAAVEERAPLVLCRYGVVFRRLLEREALAASWYELGRIYRRWEARGEIRGGYFIGGVSGEQFALPEAIGLLRSIRKAPPNGGVI